MNLILLSLAPVLIIAFYIYFRDKYEREPVYMLLLALGLGAIITIPIIGVEAALDEFWTNKFEPKNLPLLTNAAYVAFVVAALTEETFKYIAFFFVWNNKNFNEKFDGIVYAVFISLGFAGVENIMYVLQHGVDTGIIRAFTAVPAHAIFGITMGFYFGQAKFTKDDKTIKLVLALVVPILLHGIYDFILFSQNTYLLICFVPFIIYIWIAGFKRMKKHSDDSVFKPIPVTNTTK